MSEFMWSTAIGPNHMSLAKFMNRKFIFVQGKGGVGKTTIARSLAQALSDHSKITLLVSIEDPHFDAGSTQKLSPYLSHLNCSATPAFAEYVGLKLRIPAITRIFLQNKLIQYLARAAPGIKEIVTLGKIWHEKKNYDHIIIDMPSTGHGITLFQSTKNYTQIFKASLIQKDAQSMLDSFGDPIQTGHLIVALAEEMALRESLDLCNYLLQLFPKNQPLFVANRCFPQPLSPQQEKTVAVLIPKSASDYIRQRYSLERENLKIWKNKKIQHEELEYLPPTGENAKTDLTAALSLVFQKKGWV